MSDGLAPGGGGGGGVSGGADGGHVLYGQDASTPCDGELIRYCGSDGLIAQFCCGASADCAAPKSFCDLGMGACSMDQSACSEAGIHPPPCDTISATSYDQSCQTDMDCVGVYSGSTCSACFCPNSAINVNAQSAYQHDFTALDPAPSKCGCPAFGPPRCGDAGACVLP